jgi:hypothetical protein
MAKKGEKYHLKLMPNRKYVVTRVSGSSVVLKGPGDMQLETIVPLEVLKDDYKKE